MSGPGGRFVVLCRGESDASEHMELAHLAEAIARSPIWDRMGPGCLVVRKGTSPVLAALGSFDEADMERLRFLARWLPDGLRTARRLDWNEVVDAVGVLAGRLRDEFGTELQSFELRPIPRGGLIVAGLLAYALGLDFDPSRSPDGNSGPLLVVDDCAITGNRFARFLAENPGRPVVFAHLCSPEPLRGAIHRSEPRVRDVIAALDLEDRTVALFGDEAENFRSSLRGKLGDQRYWVGNAELPVFPWSAPDLNFWNSVTEQEEWGWTPFGGRIPTHSVNIGEPAGIRVRVLVEPRRMGAFHVPETVLVAEFQERLHGVDLETGDTFEMEGITAELFRGLISGEDPARIADGIADQYEVARERVESDLEDFVDQARRRGILSGPDPGAGAPGRDPADEAPPRHPGPA